MNRRDFVQKGTAFLGLAGPLPFSGRAGGRAEQQGKYGAWRSLTEHVGIYRDVVNVGVIRKNGKTLLIDSGEASILEDRHARGFGPVERVLYTHYHRDQCCGAARLK